MRGKLSGIRTADLGWTRPYLVLVHNHHASLPWIFTTMYIRGLTLVQKKKKNTAITYKTQKEQESRAVAVPHSVPCICPAIKHELPHDVLCCIWRSPSGTRCKCQKDTSLAQADWGQNAVTPMQLQKKAANVQTVSGTRKAKKQMIDKCRGIRCDQ
jgi:hypothetical protein